MEKIKKKSLWKSHFCGVNRICYLLVVRGPDTTGDLALQVDLRGPVSLPADRSHQHEAVAVGDESLGAIVGPSEVTHLQRTRQVS